MQEVAPKIRRIVFRSIERITDDGVTCGGEMDPDLMRDASLHRDLK